MDINLVKTSWIDWLIAAMFLLLFIILFVKGTLKEFNDLQTRNNPKSKWRSTVRNAFWLYGSGISMMIALGILIGLPIENLRCWFLLIPAQCILLPWLAFNIWGLKVQSGWRDVYEDFLKKIKNKEGN